VKLVCVNIFVIEVRMSVWTIF